MQGRCQRGGKVLERFWDISTCDVPFQAIRRKRPQTKASTCPRASHWFDSRLLPAVCRGAPWAETADPQRSQVESLVTSDRWTCVWMDGWMWGNNCKALPSDRRSEKHDITGSICYLKLGILKHYIKAINLYKRYRYNYNYNKYTLTLLHFKYVVCCWISGKKRGWLGRAQIFPITAVLAAVTAAITHVMKSSFIYRICHS